MMSSLKVEVSGARIRTSLPVQKLANTSRLPFARYKLLIVAQSDQPSLATDGAHLPDVINIHQRIAMNSSKAGVPETLIQGFKVLSCEVFLPCGDDPDDIAIRLKCVNFFRAE